MSRIISGAAKGLTLKTPPGSDTTRPTTDRAKEAIFSWLESRNWLNGTRVMDLYAGSGALGVEAASRGASQVLLVERHRAAVEACTSNARATNQALDDTVVLVQPVSVETALASAKPVWDLILADPPYPLTGAELDEVIARGFQVLVPDGLLVLERSVRSPEPLWPTHTETVDDRLYGETRVIFRRKIPADQP